MSRFLKTGLSFGAVLAGAAELMILHAGTSPERIYRRVLPSVMTLEVENHARERFVGSGVLALRSDIVVTAWHVVRDARSVWASFSDGQRVEVVGWIDRDSESDLALLKLKKGLPRRQVALRRELQSVATRAYVIGAPKGYGFSISDGLISQIREVDGLAQYQVSCPISPGNSGGPVLNARGEVIGIASWTKSDAQNISFAVPIREIGRLNAAARVAAWEQLPAPSSPMLRAASRSAAPEAGNPSRGDQEEAPGLEAFQKRLRAAAGKTITILLKEDGQENQFIFAVPAGGLK